MPLRLMLSNLTSHLPCELKVTFMTLELKEAVAVGLVPNWISNPSTVVPFVGFRILVAS
jgi:hypothetical protein